jgi:catecholate siderophore receptor
MFAQYLKFYQNVYPGNGPLSGAVNPAQTSFDRAAYNNTTNRDNIFNQTDFFYKVFTGPVFHSIAFGTEFGQQTGISLRNTGIFPNGTNTIVANPFAPTYFGPVNFIHQYPGALSPGVTTPDANSDYTLYTTSLYARDTIEITRWLQIIGGARFDRFDESALDNNTNTNRTLVNNKVSPQAAVILKPIENLSFYGAYSVSYLPASGDQFSTLSNGTMILAPQKFVNEEIGVKWNINPRLAVHSCGLQSQSLQRAAARPQQPGILPSVRQQQDSGLRDDAQRLRHARMAVHGRLCIHRRAGDERDIDNGRAGQPYPARSAQSVFVVEQISVYAGMERGTRRRLLL